LQARKGKSAVPAGKTSPLLVPFEFLTEKELALLKTSAAEMVRTILFLGYSIEPERASSDQAEAEGVQHRPDAMQRKAKEALSLMPMYKLGLMNAFLFAAARRGAVEIAERLLSNPSVKAQTNVVDERSRSPLHVAVECGQLTVASLLIEYNSDLELCDEHGMSVLAIASFLVCAVVALLLLLLLLLMLMLIFRRATDATSAALRVTTRCAGCC
jgi:hypothetical protein